MIQKLTSAATIAIPVPEHRCEGATIYQLTPGVANALTWAGDGLPGQLYVFELITSGTTSYVSTFSTGILSTGTLTSGTVDAKTFIVNFVSDGIRLIETGRTAAM